MPPPSNIYRVLLHFSLPACTHAPFPLNVSPPSSGYLVLLIPPHKSPLIHCRCCIHSFLWMRGSVMDWHSRAVQEGAVVTSHHGTVPGHHSSEGVGHLQASPGHLLQFLAPSRLQLSALVGFCIFLFLLYLFFFLSSLLPTANDKIASSSQTSCKPRNQLFLETEF